MVPAGKESLKADDAVLVRSLDTAQPDRILNGLAALVERRFGVQVLFGPAGVDAHGIAVPDVNVDIGDGLAGINVKYGDVEA